jgi:Family of unknown function (DUF6069)
MSSITMSPSVAVNSSAPNASRNVEWGTVAWLGVATVAAASIANVLVYFAGDAIVGYDPAFPELGSALGIAICTVVPAIIAVLLYAALMLKANNPARTFTIVSAVVLVVTLIPDFTFIPTEPGVSNGQIAVLTVMHTVAAVMIVRLLTTFTRS